MSERQLRNVFIVYLNAKSVIMYKIAINSAMPIFSRRV